MPAAENQRHRRLLHPGNQLGNRKPRLNVAADGVQKQQQPVNLLRLLHRRQQRNDMLILRRLHRLGKDLMPLDLSDDCERINIAPA